MGNPIDNLIEVGPCMPPQVTDKSDWVTIGTIPKRSRPNNAQKLLPQGTNNSESWQPARPSIQVKSVQEQDQVDPVVKKFKEAIKDAERSTLVFNLDMGKVPIMNRETMNKRATLALTTMATRKEQKTTSVPSEEAVMAIDDLLSVTEGMEFFGACTKSYSHPNDPNSRLYCTVPVKYEFKDKDSRVRAETTLRDRCDVRCTTPYPSMVRECIKQIISKVKSDRPDRLVKVNVDTGSLTFKIATKGKGVIRMKSCHGNPITILFPFPLRQWMSIEGGSLRTLRSPGQTVPAPGNNLTRRSWRSQSSRKKALRGRAKYVPSQGRQKDPFAFLPYPPY
jgi:hypothetical protein